MNIRTTNNAVIAAVLAFFTLLACKKNDTTQTPALPSSVTSVLNLPSTSFNYSNPTLPGYLTAPPITAQIQNPNGNTTTDWGATLGRVLFYEKNLSFNKTISCASCHKQANAFADPVTLSKGFDGGSTGRNSMGLTDAQYYPVGKYFWDQRAATLEDQALMPIQDHVEMGMTLTEMESRVRSLTYYPFLFSKAFGDTSISSTRIAKAVAQFVRSIESHQSKYDAGRSAFPTAPAPPPNAPFSNFTAEENRGKEIFLTPQIGGCAGCHGTETFTAPTEKNNGLDMVTVDRGVGGITNNTNMDGEFKSGSLRNVELTAPFMHDGRFTTLEQVVEHYSTGVKAHPNLSPQLKLPNGNPRLLNLSVADKAALVAFLKTLTDTHMITDPKYADPFK